MTYPGDRRGRGRWLTLGALMVAAVACGGGGGGSPSAPSSPAAPSSPSTPASPVVTDPATTITITSAGVSPREVQVAVGGRVTFVNSDNAFHEMTSNPHPIHTDCPEINAVGAIGPGTTRQTAVFTRAGTCGYHDHGQDTNTALQGRIVIR